MQIGEAVAVLVDTGGPMKCPFCESTAGPTFEKKEMKNDAVKLASNAGGMTHATCANPESTKDYEIYSKYWISDDESQIVMSPHHVLPGNASIARCPEILKWMAGTCSVTKEEHSKTVMAALKTILANAKNVPASKRAAAVDQMVAQALPPKPLKESPDGVVVFAYDGKKVDSHTKPATDNYVTGKITFDVNDRQNCMWLPSHCTIANWSAMVGEDGWHTDQDSSKHKAITFEVAYAYNSMKKTKVQFHDAHGDYSEAVIKALLNLEVKLQQLADQCLTHPGTTSKQNGPYRAPMQLTSALYKLADLCTQKLNLKKTKPKAPWYTSSLALEVAKHMP